MSCIGITPLLAIKLSVFDWSINWFKVTRQNKFFDIWNSALGAFAGISAVACVYPTDVIRRYMQVSGLDSAGISEKEAKSVIGCMKGMYRKGGITTFYRGLSVSLVKEIPSSAIMFMMNERMKSLLKMSN